jgi:hypothetical protein
LKPLRAQDHVSSQSKFAVLRGDFDALRLEIDPVLVRRRRWKRGFGVRATFGRRWAGFGLCRTRAKED